MIPSVSVVMPVYNVERWVGAAVRSVLAQTVADWELVVVDDGSPDGSADICRSFADRRIRIVTQPNAGLAAARNTGILASQAPFVALLDGDDAMLPRKLETHLSALRWAGRPGIAYATSRLVNEDGKPNGVLQVPIPDVPSPADVFCGKVVLNGSVPVFSRETLDAAALHADGRRPWFFDETLRRSEDVEAWTRVALLADAAWLRVDGEHTDYRVTRSSLSADVDQQLASWEEACRRVAAYAPAFVAEHGRAARGWEMRYLARRCFQMRRPGQGLRMLAAGLAANPAMIVREPKKTVVTAGALVAMAVAGPRAAEAAARKFGMR